MLDIVGPSEIADMLKVHPVTVDRWRREGVLPPAEAALRRGPVWEKRTIVEWGLDTQRLVYTDQGVLAPAKATDV